MSRPVEVAVAPKIGSLSKDVFEGRTSTGSEPFSLFICLDANKFVLLSFFSLMKRIYPRVSNKSLPNDAKGPLPVDVRRSTTLLLKLPNVSILSSLFIFSHTRDFAFTPLQNMSGLRRFQFNLQAFDKNVHSHGRYGLKKF